MADLNQLFSRLRLPVEGRMPGFAGANDWLNTEPLGPRDLDGKVVVVDFWTYTCINWLRTLPYIRAWAGTYGEKGLVVVGVHTPEFGVEHDLDNVRRSVREMHIEYPVAIDNDYAVWSAFANQYWPALYFADAQGRIRHHHFGEGGYERSEHVIRQLLTEAGVSELPSEPAPVEALGIELPAEWHDLRSPETYVGFARSDGFASPEAGASDEPRVYTVPSRLHVNQWGLAGDWTLGFEEAVSNEANGRIAYRFHARDLNLILVPPARRSSARFRVLLDGQAPGDAHGLDVDEEGNGVVEEPRLYQLIRQSDHIADRLFEIELLDPGAAALCFTFG
jgi:thiol-disulfide isomerase/thioredoxin